MNGAASGARSLLCRVRKRLCSIPLGHVVEIMRPLPLVAFTGMPPFVCGVSVIRGIPTPVVDPGRLFAGVPETEPGRYVTVRAGTRIVALAVDEVSGIGDLTGTPGAERPPLPPLLREATAEELSELGALDSELLIVLRSAHWVPEPIWQAIEAGGSTA